MTDCQRVLNGQTIGHSGLLGLAIWMISCRGNERLLHYPGFILAPGLTPQNVVSSWSWLTNLTKSTSGYPWRHDFDMRIIPTQSSTERKIITPEGSVETWLRSGSSYTTQHKEYRGELELLDNFDFVWSSPPHLGRRAGCLGYRSICGNLPSFAVQGLS